MVGLDKTTMVVTIDELEPAGMAERLPSPTDRRARIIGVTKDGRKAIAKGERSSPRSRRTSSRRSRRANARPSWEPLRARVRPSLHTRRVQAGAAPPGLRAFTSGADSPEQIYLLRSRF